jgi:hypothetical protein
VARKKTIDIEWENLLERGTAINNNGQLPVERDYFSPEIRFFGKKIAG